MTIATLASGGEGVGVGAAAAGLRHLWGIELDDAIAQVARMNGFNVVTGDVTLADPCEFERPRVLHASPPCPNFSQANLDGVEEANDVAIAEATVRFIRTLSPDVFTLENVWQYHRSRSWQIICDALYDAGYWIDVQHLNTADFGVPQTRKRMIVRATRGWLPPLPPLEPWRGWYEAIEDLIPDLPESKFAPWQLAKLGGFLDSTLVDSAGYPDGNGARIAVQRHTNEPANTIVANHGRRPMRAFIVGGCNAGQDELTVRMQDEPTNTITASNRGALRAFIVSGQNSRPGSRGRPRFVDEPYFTVTASASSGREPRAWVGKGRVVTLSVRCLARLQTFPDWYELPGSNILACKIVGNAVAPLFYQKIVTSWGLT